MNVHPPKPDPPLRPRLRRDRVVRRVEGALRVALSGLVPAGCTLWVTATAPLRRPAVLTEGIVREAREFLGRGRGRGDVTFDVGGNPIRLRCGAGRSASPAKLVFLVHSAGVDSSDVLAAYAPMGSHKSPRMAIRGLSIRDESR
jgi:hypothetical protein